MCLSPKKEDKMSSVHGVYLPENLVQSTRRFWFMDFFIKSTVIFSLAFIVYVTLRGVLW